MARNRTNIEIEKVYLRAVMDRSGVGTKTEAVDLALRHLAGQPMTRDEALAMRGSRSIGAVYRSYRRAGVTPRGPVDCMVASVALRHNATLPAQGSYVHLVAGVAGIPIDDASQSAGGAAP